LTNDVYQSWLTDRGLESPGSQPFELLGSKWEQSSECLILASAQTEDSASTLEAVKKLAEALSQPNKPVSWFVLKSDQSELDLKLFKSMLPGLSRVISLSENCTDVHGQQFLRDVKIIAGQKIGVFVGPTMNLMSSDPEIKRRFWNEVRVWLHD
jgi:hypothetical protein